MIFDRLIKGFLSRFRGDLHTDDKEADYSSHAYDKAKWHYDGEFPEDVPEENAFTHTGFYLTWLAERDLVSRAVKSRSGKLLSRLAARDVSPIALYEWWDGCLIGDMLSAEGNAFSSVYFDFQTGDFMADFYECFPDQAAAYQVSPTWENYDAMTPVLDRRLAAWREAA